MEKLGSMVLMTLVVLVAMATITVQQGSWGDPWGSYGHGDSDNDYGNGDGDNDYWNGDGDDNHRNGDGDDNHRNGDGDDNHRNGDGDDDHRNGDGDDNYRNGDGDNSHRNGDGDDNHRNGDGDDNHSNGDGDNNHRNGDGDDNHRNGDGDDNHMNGDGDDNHSNGDACRHGSTTYDQCNQKCKCLYGFPAQCTRVRKEFSSMTIEERRRYIQTIRTASTDPVYKPEYDRLIGIHRQLFSTAIHRKDHFLPWHRWYLLRYENLMRQIDCRFTVAYWDWGKDSGHPWRQLTRDVWYTGTTGLGGNGSGRGRCVRTGPFREGRWQLTPSGGNQCLARQFTGTPPDTVAIMELLRTSANNFHEFELALRIVFHDQVHCQIGGTMCTQNSANAPEFFLHHAMVDRIWYDWQKKSPTHRYAFFTSVRGNMPGTQHRPSSFLTLDRHPSWVRVEYATPSGQEETLSRFRGMTFKQLQKVPNRPRMSALSPSALRLFQVNAAESSEARRLQAKFLPK